MLHIGYFSFVNFFRPCLLLCENYVENVLYGIFLWITCAVSGELGRDICDVVFDRILCAVFYGILNVRAESMCTRSLVLARCTMSQSIKTMPV